MSNLNKYENGLIYNLEKLGCKGLADRLSIIFSNSHVKDEDLLSVIVNATDEEIIMIKQQRAERLLRQAKLYNTYANLDLLEFLPERNLDKRLMERLSTCEFIREKANVIITGAAGTGKTFIARALGVQACNEGWRTRFYHLNKIMRDLTDYDNRSDNTQLERRMNFYARIPVLIIDEWFSFTLTRAQLSLLHELIDMRYGNTTTIICSQMPSYNWHEFCPNKALGESITGRLLGGSYEIELKGKDLRKVHRERP